MAGRPVWINRHERGGIAKLAEIKAKGCSRPDQPGEYVRPAHHPGRGCRLVLEMEGESAENKRNGEKGNRPSEIEPGNPSAFPPAIEQQHSRQHDNGGL